MKLSAALFALFAFPALVTSILLDSVNDGYVNVSMAAKRLDEQNIDKRQLSDAMIDIVDSLFVYADEYNHYRGYSRSAFTQNIVQALYNHNPHFNYIICYTEHAYNFGSPWGVNVYNEWVSYEIKNWAATVNFNYDVVIGKNGTFTRDGQGGFLNWAYIGKVSSVSGTDAGTTVTFDTPD